MFVNRASMLPRVEALRKRGVKFPATYPQNNIDQDPVSTRGTLAQIEVAELLADLHDPTLIEVEPGIPGGDVDIVVRLEPPLFLQVKDLASVAVDKGGYESKTLAFIEQVKREIHQEHATNPEWSQYSAIRIRPGTTTEAAYDGQTLRVMRDLPAHVMAIEVDPDLARPLAEKKIPRVLNLAAGQIPRVGGARRIPVLNLARFPHDQAHVVKLLRAHFAQHGASKDLAGAVLVTGAYPGPNPDGPTPIHLRMIPVPNTGRAEEQRLREADFNRNMGDETLYQDRIIVFDVEQVHRGRPDPLELRGNEVYLGGTRFGELPLPGASDGYGLLYGRPAFTVPAPGGRAAIPPRSPPGRPGADGETGPADPADAAQGSGADVGDLSDR